VKGTGKLKIEIKTEKGLTIRTISEDAKKGLNYYSFDLALDSNLLSDYQKAYNDSKGKDDDELKLIRKDSGKYYLAAGKYTAVFTDAGGATVKKEFVITKPKNRQKPRQDEEDMQHN
jgi:hypothetical protein